MRKETVLCNFKPLYIHPVETPNKETQHIYIYKTQDGRDMKQTSWNV
jgi:hypothetical protein